MMDSNKYNTQDRLNHILDRISKFGIESLSEYEIGFLESFSTNQEEELNQILNEIESETVFESDDGLFTFELEEIHYYHDYYHLIGTINVPDIKTRGKISKGRLHGKIIVYRKDQFAVDFSDGTYDIFEFCSGFEYELDIFIDEIIQKVGFLI